MNPFLLPSQSVISFSGGRTSGVMLRRCLDAHDGRLPNGVVVVFCNTGKEREETLEFVKEVGEQWNIPIHWLEYEAIPHEGKFRKKDGKQLWNHTYKIVDFETASRNGEPFEKVIATRNFLPNPVMRFCTGEMKIKTTWRFVTKGLRWESYTNAIGFRADEPTRVYNIQGKIKKAKATGDWLFPDCEEDEEEWKKPLKEETVVCPLFEFGVNKADVEHWWSKQAFDLRLQPHEGNCDLCFLKGLNKIQRIIQDSPSRADWWANAEKKIAKAGTAKYGTFRSDRPKYLELQMIAEGKTPPGHLDFGASDLSDDGRGCSMWDDCRCTD